MIIFGRSRVNQLYFCQVDLTADVRYIVCLNKDEGLPAPFVGTPYPTIGVYEGIADCFIDIITPDFEKVTGVCWDHQMAPDTSYVYNTDTSEVDDNNRIIVSPSTFRKPSVPIFVTYQNSEGREMVLRIDLNRCQKVGKQF
jgi:hypothetical protein